MERKGRRGCEGEEKRKIVKKKITDRKET